MGLSKTMWKNLQSHKCKILVLVLAPILLLKSHTSSQIAHFVHFQSSHECITFALFKLKDNGMSGICQLKCSPLKGHLLRVQRSCFDKCNFSFYFFLAETGVGESSQLPFIYSPLTMLYFPPSSHHSSMYLCSNRGMQVPKGQEPC